MSEIGDTTKLLTPDFAPSPAVPPMIPPEADYQKAPQARVEVALDRLAEGKNKEGAELSPQEYADQFEVFRQGILEGGEYTPDQVEQFKQIFAAVEEGRLPPEEVMMAVSRSKPPELTPEEREAFEEEVKGAQEAVHAQDPNVKKEKARKFITGAKELYKKHPKLILLFGGAIALVLMAIFKGAKSIASGGQRG